MVEKNEMLARPELTDARLEIIDVGARSKFCHLPIYASFIYVGRMF